MESWAYFVGRNFYGDNLDIIFSGRHGWSGQLKGREWGQLLFSESRALYLRHWMYSEVCTSMCDVFVQELIEKYDISVLPTFVAFKGGDQASSFALLGLSINFDMSYCSASNNNNSAVANSLGVSCAHNTSRTSIVTPWPWRITQGHWKRNHWIDHTRLTISRVLCRIFIVT